jgi:(1->4)-alpha-D-glucan 1-alpha-D-glucosylmutase
LWDLSLVDPDNRRPFDYDAREAALDALAPLGGADCFETLLASRRDGRIKLALTALLLVLRRDNATLFAEGAYAAIEMNGVDADWALGFVRSLGEKRITVLAARFPALREAKPDWQAWASLPEGRWRNLLRGRSFDPLAPLAASLGRLPIAFLAADGATA